MPASMYSKDEKVLCFHHEILYDAKILDVRHKDSSDKKSPLEYKVHYKGWKNTWDDWVLEDRLRKATDENRELAANIRREAEESVRAKSSKSGPKKRGTSERDSVRDSEERGNSVPGRGNKRARGDNDIESTLSSSEPPHPWAVLAPFTLTALFILALFILALFILALSTPGQSPLPSSILRSLIIEPSILSPSILALLSSEDGPKSDCLFLDCSSVDSLFLSHRHLHYLLPSSVLKSFSRTYDPNAMPRRNRPSEGDSSRRAPQPGFRADGSMSDHDENGNVRMWFDRGNGASLAYLTGHRFNPFVQIIRPPHENRHEEDDSEEFEDDPAEFEEDYPGHLVHGLPPSSGQEPYGYDEGCEQDPKEHWYIESIEMIPPVVDDNNEPDIIWASHNEEGEYISNQGFNVLFVEDYDDVNNEDDKFITPVFQVDEDELDAHFRELEELENAEDDDDRENDGDDENEESENEDEDETDNDDEDSDKESEDDEETDDEENSDEESHKESDDDQKDDDESDVPSDPSTPGKHCDIPDFSDRDYPGTPEKMDISSEDIPSNPSTPGKHFLSSDDSNCGHVEACDGMDRSPEDEDEKENDIALPPIHIMHESEYVMNDDAKWINQEEQFQTRPSIRIVMPDNLKSLIVDDWERVSKNSTVVDLPAPKSVRQILNEYRDEEAPKRAESRIDVDVLEEVIAGLLEYFDVMLDKILLYRYERPQYRQLKKQYSEQENFGPVAVYGAEHLLRLFSLLPELLAQTNMTQTGTNRMREELSKLSIWLSKNSEKYFRTEYVSATDFY
ncbi:Chromatin modification-related protein eaf3 [Penicillium capsulatum]|uniref:Chromatin modification-related protein EAF3 n=1 Tax=Penicillium capsulatum TaxID=69766 RepID=A0A9W9IL48_9EURO|nr:Chromatin modification-related protein eaf3 [Penicillium capsulatum]